MGRVNEGGMHFIRFSNEYRAVYAEYRNEAEYVNRNRNYVPAMQTCLFTSDGQMIIDLRTKKSRRN